MGEKPNPSGCNQQLLRTGGAWAMLDYLEQLTKEGQWEEALIIAEQLVQKTDNTVEDMVRINLALIAARSVIGEQTGVITLGDHAAGMAADVGNWDAYLTICHYIAFAHARLNQMAQAKQYWLNYIANMAKSDAPHPYEIVTWFNLGVMASIEADDESSAYYYEQAKKVTLQRGTERQLLGVNHALIHVYTRLRKFQQVPPLLAETLHYLRNNQGIDEWLKARFFHFKVRAEFAVATKRFTRATRVAARCLELAVDFPEHRYYMHMILANVARETHQHHDMVRHLTSARVAAIRARRYDCELTAAEGLYQFLQTNPQDSDSVQDEVSADLPMSWFEIDDPRRL
jgi:hypothetical protein